jgi:hypothetical protein
MICSFLVPLVAFAGCSQGPIEHDEVLGRYVAHGRVPRGGTGDDYFELRADGTYVRFLKGSGDSEPSISYGTWSIKHAENRDDIVLDAFRWAPWQIPPGLPANVVNNLRSPKPGISVGEIDRYKGTLRIRFMADVDYWFLKERAAP